MNSIYALTDPITSEIRYVGKTRNVTQRHTGHCHGKSDTHVSRWVQCLKREGLYPTMIVIESGLSDTDWPDAEQFWIAYYKSLGARLTNIAKGGHDIVKREPLPFGYTMGVKVPAMRRNEVCVRMFDTDAMMFFQVTDAQAQRIREMDDQYDRMQRIRQGKHMMSAKVRPKTKTGNVFLFNPDYGCRVSGTERANIHEEYMQLPAPPEKEEASE